MGEGDFLQRGKKNINIGTKSKEKAKEWI